jgi:putative transposase
MPRANRYILPGYVYHLTHRCHDRKFLLKFAQDRNRYRKRLREAVLEFKVSLLTYNITSNHVHLVTYADQAEQIAGLMQQSAGEWARYYNRRKKRSGAFWEGRYHATMVDSGAYLWECLKYVELNMVRCGVVRHPREWSWSGYSELMGCRKRNRLLDIDKLLWLLRASSVAEFRLHLNAALEEAIAKDQLRREPKWTESLAVGSQAFVERIENTVRNRQETECSREDGLWILREDHGLIFRPQNEAMSLF